MNLFTSLIGSMDTTLTAFGSQAVSNLAHYLTGFVRTAGIIVLVMAALHQFYAPFPQAIQKYFGTFFLIALVANLATEAANYNAYVGTFLLHLPDDFLSALSPGSFGDTASIGVSLDATVSRMMDGVSKIWNSGSIGNYFGPALLAALMFFLLCCLGAAALISIVIGKVGIAIVVAIGPIFVMTLVSPYTREFFTRWLSYAFQYAVLQLLIGAVMLIADSVLGTYVKALTDPGAVGVKVGDPVEMLAPAIIMVVLTYLFSQLPSMASSITGGIGLHSASAWNMAKGTPSAAWSGAKGIGKGGRALYNSTRGNTVGEGGAGAGGSGAPAAERPRAPAAPANTVSAAPRPTEAERVNQEFIDSAHARINQEAGGRERVQ